MFFKKGKTQAHCLCGNQAGLPQGYTGVYQCPLLLQQAVAPSVYACCQDDGLGTAPCHLGRAGAS